MFKKKEDFFKFSVYFLNNHHDPSQPFTEELIYLYYKEYVRFSVKYIKSLKLFSYCSVEFEEEFKEYDVCLYSICDDFKNMSYYYFSIEKIEKRSKEFLEELKDKYGIDYKKMKYIGEVCLDENYFLSLLELKNNFLRCF